MDSRVTTVPVEIPLSDLRPEIQLRTSGGCGTIDLDAVVQLVKLSGRWYVEGGDLGTYCES
jgi:hypothetical protein